MAVATKLKVFRLTIGFHDAYVAAPTKKAAIEAWGSDPGVFGRGEAELVTDPQLMSEPLARPGEIVKRLRGTAAEQLAALEPDERTSAARSKVPKTAAAKKQMKPASKPKPRPSRALLDEAEAALADAEARHRLAVGEIAEREAARARERALLEEKERQERERLEARRDKADAAFHAAMERWRVA